MCACDVAVLPDDAKAKPLDVSALPSLAHRLVKACVGCKCGLCSLLLSELPKFVAFLTGW